MKYSLAFLILLSAIPCRAQVLSPEVIDNRYHFHKGQELYYQLVDQFRDPSIQDPNSAANYDHYENFDVKVEDVDASGNATLVVSNTERFDWKGGSDGTKVKMGGRATDIPMYRITVDPFGHYVDGKILKISQQDSLFLERMKDPHVKGRQAPDSTRMKRSKMIFLPDRNEPQQLSLGVNWNDTVKTIKHSTHYDLGAPSPSSPKEEPKNIDYDLVISQHSARRIDSAHYSLATVENKDEVFASQLTTWHLESTQSRRKSDGILTHMTTGYSATKEGKNIFGYTHRELQLVGEK